jgi:hypothetical protein
VKIPHVIGRAAHRNHCNLSRTNDSVTQSYYRQCTKLTSYWHLELGTVLFLKLRTRSRVGV